MAEKILNTRIQLKYDDWAKWNTAEAKAKVLKRGEVALVAVPSGLSCDPQNTNPDPFAPNKTTTAPTILFKVGDGTTPFGELKWGSALAADVYDWAKKEKLEQSDIIDILPKYVSSVKGAGDAEITIVPTEQSTGNVVLTVSHAKHTKASAKTASTATISGYAGTGTIKIPKIETNDAGHVIGLTEETVNITMPSAQDIPNITITGEPGQSTEGTVKVLNDLDASGHAITQKFTEVPTKAYVDAKVAGSVQYWGVVSKAEDLGKDMTKGGNPTITVGLGDFYRVGTAFGSYKVGDLLIANKENAGSTTSNYDRVVQEDYKGTVTSIDVKAGSGITIPEVGPITSSGKFTINHTTPKGATPGKKGGEENTRTYLQSITTDDFGHITGATTATETVTDTKYTAEPEGGLKLTGTAFAIDDATTFVFNCGSSTELI